MDDEEETYRLWKIRKTIMQVIYRSLYVPASLACNKLMCDVKNTRFVHLLVKLSYEVSLN